MNKATALSKFLLVLKGFHVNIGFGEVRLRTSHAGRSDMGAGDQQERFGTRERKETH